MIRIQLDRIVDDLLVVECRSDDMSREVRLPVELLPTIQELDDQRLRVDRVLEHLKQIKSVKWKALAEEVVNLLESISGEILSKLYTINEKLVWNWLRRSDQRVAELERLVYYRS